MVEHFRQEDTSTLEPVQMQSVLSDRGQASQASSQKWVRDSNIPSEVRISHGTIDDNRLKRLSQIVDTVNRSIWVDIITWIVAVLIGVGVGFAFLKVFFPDLVNPRPIRHEQVGSLDVRAFEE